MIVARIARFLRRLLRTAPRPGSVRRAGDGAEEFRAGAWQPLPRHRAAGSGRPGPDSPALAIRCPQPACREQVAIGTVWPRRWTGAHLDTGSAADSAAARTLTADDGPTP